MGDPRAFYARLVANASFGRLYRVYAAGDELFFIRIGGQGRRGEGPTRQPGLIGLLVQRSIRKRAEKREKALIDAIDRTSPEQLLARHQDNFRMAAADVLGGAVDPPSFLATHGPHVGRWRLTLRDERTINFQFETIEDMRSALDVLPALLSREFHVNVRWNDCKKSFEKREDAA